MKTIMLSYLEVRDKEQGWLGLNGSQIWPTIDLFDEIVLDVYICYTIVKKNILKFNGHVQYVSGEIVITNFSVSIGVHARFFYPHNMRMLAFPSFRKWLTNSAHCRAYSRACSSKSLSRMRGLRFCAATYDAQICGSKLKAQLQSWRRISLKRKSLAHRVKFCARFKHSSACDRFTSHVSLG